MATITLGTTAQTTLTALAFQRAGLLPADIATISQLISNPVGTTEEYASGGEVGGNKGPFGAFARNGQLYIPNRGVLTMMPGDVVGVDALGWPILVSSASAANATYWIHT